MSGPAFEIRDIMADGTDVSSAMRLVYLHGYPPLLLSLSVLAGTGAITYFSGIPEETLIRILLLGAMILLCLTVALQIYLHYYIRSTARRASQDPLFKTRLCVIATPDGFTSESERGITAYKWTDFTDMRENDRIIALLTRVNLLVLVPKRFATPENLHNFLEAAKDNIKKD